MWRQLVFAVYFGPHADAFQTLLGEVYGNHEIEVLPVKAEEGLIKALSDYPRAATFIETDSTLLYKRVRKKFPASPIVGVVNGDVVAEKLAKAGLFDIVQSSDPSWKLLLAVRNATDYSALLETNNTLNRTVADSERMITAAAGSVGIVHETRNVLYGIAGMLMLEYDKSGKTSKMNFLNKAVRLINTVNKQLNYVLACKPETKKRKTRGVQVGKIAARVTDLMASSFELAGITLERYIEIILPTVHACATGIASVILELLVNSFKACNQGDSVKLRVVRDEDNILLEVSDTARHPEHAQNGKHALKSLPMIVVHKQSSGLGLVLAERIARTHGSTIETFAGPDSGSVYRLRLPLHKSCRSQKLRVRKPDV